jgi:5-methylcytosine-specific restriction enzyme A
MTAAKPKLLVRRSPRWAYARKKHLLKEPVCQWCNGVENLQVHHVVPFHLDRSLELDPTNFITLCEKLNYNCHLRVGHLGAWVRFNKNVRKDCAERQLARNTKQKTL